MPYRTVRYGMYVAAEKPERPLPAAFSHPPWAHRTTCACWTMERLEHVELVAARDSIRERPLLVL